LASHSTSVGTGPNRQSAAVELPHGLRNPRAVVIHQNVHVLGVMAGKMGFADRCDRQSLEVVEWVEPEVPRADAYIAAGR
jgi:hypothetical protein